MKLETIHIDNTVRSGLNSFTDGVIFRDTKVLITLNLPDGQKTTIEGEWRHMSDGTVAKLAMRQPFVLFKGLTFQKLCLP
ncbi:hypothetical protein ACKUD5_28615, partial [Klebsiella pneumoniae]